MNVERISPFKYHIFIYLVSLVLQISDALLKINKRYIFLAGCSCVTISPPFSALRNRTETDEGEGDEEKDKTVTQ